MFFARHHRRIGWIVLASYLLAGVAAESVHEHGSHGKAENHREAEHHCEARHAAPAQTDSCDATSAAASVYAADPPVSADDDCAICRFLGRVRLATPTAAPSVVCRLVTALACSSPPVTPGKFFAAPHSRGPPRLA